MARCPAAARDPAAGRSRPCKVGPSVCLPGGAGSAGLTLWSASRGARSERPPHGLDRAAGVPLEAGREPSLFPARPRISGLSVPPLLQSGPPRGRRASGAAGAPGLPRRWVRQPGTPVSGPEMPVEAACCRRTPGALMASILGD